MRLEKRYVRAAGGAVSAGVLAWVAVSSGNPVQADPDNGGDHGGDHGEPEPDDREGSELFLSGTEGPPGSKFTIGGRDCDEPDMGTHAEVIVEHEDGTTIEVAPGGTDGEGNWEVTAVIPEDMAEGALSIEAACWLDEPVGVVGFFPMQPQTPVFSYASSTFNVTLPTTDTTEPPGGNGDGNGNGNGNGDGNGGPDDGSGDGTGSDGAAGTSSSATSAGAAPGVAGEADYTG